MDASLSPHRLSSRKRTVSLALVAPVLLVSSCAVALVVADYLVYANRLGLFDAEVSAYADDVRSTNQGLLRDSRLIEGCNVVLNANVPPPSRIHFNPALNVNAFRDCVISRIPNISSQMGALYLSLGVPHDVLREALEDAAFREIASTALVIGRKRLSEQSDRDMNHIQLMNALRSGSYVMRFLTKPHQVANDLTSRSLDYLDIELARPVALPAAAH